MRLPFGSCPLFCQPYEDYFLCSVLRTVLVTLVPKFCSILGLFILEGLGQHMWPRSDCNSVFFQ